MCKNAKRPSTIKFIFPGVGGNGGSVYVKTIENITLHRVLQQYPDRRVKAGVGENSRPHVLLGKAGEDAIIEVPPGVSVVDSANRQLGERASCLETSVFRLVQ